MAQIARPSGPPAVSETNPMLGALRQAGIMLFGCDLDLRYTWLANPLPGLSEVIAVGMGDEELFGPGDAGALLALKRTVLTKVQAAQGEIAVTVAGRRLLLDVRADVVRDEAGRVTGLTGALIDRTDQATTRSAAPDSADRDRIFAQATREGVLLHDGERVIEANDAFCRMVGLERDSVVGRPPMSFVAPQSRSYALAQAAARARGPDELFGARSDGSAFPMQVIVERVEYQGRSLRIAHIRDLTAEKLAEAALRESEERYRALAAATREGVVIHDGERIVEVNEAFCALHGTTRDQAIGRPCYTFIVRETCPFPLDDIARVSSEPYEAMARREDGSLFPVEAAGRPLLFRGRLTRVATVRDLSDRKRAETALRESEERLRGFAEASSDILWVVDAASRAVEYLSPSYERVWGEPTDAVIGSADLWTRRLHPEDRERVLDMVARTAQGERLEVEYRIVRPDGGIRWIRDSGFPIRGTDGAVRRAAGLARDITLRKETEARQKLLLSELNHRVKNTLATVQSVAQQTLRSAASLDVFRERFEDRLLALSKTHNLLTEEHWERASLLSLLKQELAPYGQGRYHLAGAQDVHLAPRAAVALGMALHELTTNAAKYGALSSPDGAVRLSWSVLRGSPPRLGLEWRESGGPPITVAPTRRGFGSRLLERGVGLELGGSVRLDFAPTGLTARIEMPLDAAAVPS